MGYSGARGILIYEKKLMSKISCKTPFNKNAALRKVTYLCHMPTTAEGKTSFPGKIEASPNSSAPIQKEFNQV
jgi:hypothetical protein